MSAAPKLCLVEDDPIMGESLCDRFLLEGLRYDWHQSAGSALARIGKEPYAAIISDIRLPDLSGEEMMRELLAREVAPPPVIFITGFGSIDRAVEALKLGARDYITKPFDLALLVDKARQLMCEHAGGADGSASEPVLGVSPAMRRLEELLPRLAAHDETVLLVGESGVGKERIARRLHALRPEAAGRPFVAVNCAALSETLLESELFGHERGAFTGALRPRRGMFEQAQGGTLLLDEIGEMSALMQVKLLRAIQEREITRVGAERPLAVDIRLVCASNRDLRRLVEEGRFREDLYYRVNVIQLRVPPLRERQEDILWLARRFLADQARRHPGPPRRLGPSAESALLRYPWPGNVRELKHAIERACVLGCGSVIQPWDLFQADPGGPERGAVAPADEASLGHYLRSCERDFILRALEAQGWRMSDTAQELGISRKNLWEKMRKLGIPGRTE
jgi:DNA-binding NtrC family response regulator